MMVYRKPKLADVYSIEREDKKLDFSDKTNEVRSQFVSCYWHNVFFVNWSPNVIRDGDSLVLPFQSSLGPDVVSRSDRFGTTGRLSVVR